MIFHLHIYISYLFRRCLSLRRAPYFLTVAALSVGLIACSPVKPTEGKSSLAATSEAVAEQSWVDRYRWLLDEEAPYFGKPGERRPVWSPTELPPEALRRIGFDLSFDQLTSDDRVPGIMGNFSFEAVGESPVLVPRTISIDIWPKRIPEWREGAVVPFPTPNEPDLAISRIVALGDPDTECWLLMDTRYGTLGTIFFKGTTSKISIEQACEYGAGVMKRYLEEFALWLEEHPEFDPPLDAYGPRD